MTTLPDTLVVPIETTEGTKRSACTDWVASEEPLEIRVNGMPLSVTMRTPGHDTDLAVGFLFTEGIIERHSQIVSIQHSPREDGHSTNSNVLEIRLAPDIEVDVANLQRSFYATSSCGICGKASIDAIAARPRRQVRNDGPFLCPELVYALPNALRAAQTVFQRTGGLHAAALFSVTGEILALREDIGRHNALDKLIGAKLIGCGLPENELPFSDSVLLVSGRAGFELVQKAAMAGIPILAAVGAPSSLAVQAALRFGMTLIGFVRGKRFNTYSGAWRVR
jgi:FdhD protein